MKLRIILGALLFAISLPSAAKEKDKKHLIVMKNASTGKTVEFASATANEAEAELIVSDVKLPKWMKSCDEGKKKVSMNNVELELELGFLIENLQETDHPQLTKTQKQLLESVPLCNSYLVKLKVIGLLLQNYRVVANGNADFLATND